MLIIKGERLMQIKQLEYFVAVAEELSFTRAAKRFFISQAALSMQIRSLEKEVGCRLFDRDNHHVELTPAGRSFLEDARAILSQTEDAIRRARHIQEGEGGTLRIGFIKGFERSNLAQMLAKFHERYPNVTLSLVRENVAELYDALRSDKIDVAINLFYSAEQMGPIQWQEIRRYPLCAVVPAHSPLSHRSSISLEELCGLPLIDIAKGSSNYGEADEIAQTLAALGTRPHVAFVSEDVETSILCVAAGLGFALLPGYLTDTITSKDEVVALPIEDMQRKMCVVAAWMPDNKNELTDVFLDEFLQVDDNHA